MVSWVLLGRVYPVIEWPDPDPRNPMAPNPSNARTVYGRGCKPTFDSHYALMHKRGNDGCVCLAALGLIVVLICV